MEMRKRIERTMGENGERDKGERGVEKRDSRGRREGTGVKKHIRRVVLGTNEVGKIED